MARNRNWTYEDTMAAFALYLILPRKEMVATNSEVKAFAEAIGRTPDSVKFKLANISAWDENRLVLGRKGLANGSKLDKRVWDDYRDRGDAFLQECTVLLTERLSRSGGNSSRVFDVIELPPEGKEREIIVAQRVNQCYFRNSLMHNYHERCCVTGIATSLLLVASHIKPWRASDPKTERLAASNGLLLNALHDRAFDRGLITLTTDYRVRVSSEVGHSAAEEEFLWRYSKQQIALPSRNSPKKEFIEYHNDVIFKG